MIMAGNCFPRHKKILRAGEDEDEEEDEEDEEDDEE
tara:strand:+ start:2249 stop:2356 length:108 start_codon:yes stop_codon:yes gene_type:complete